MSRTAISATGCVPSASLCPRLVRIYRALRGEITYGSSRAVWRMPAMQALERARAHIRIMGEPL